MKKKLMENLNKNDNEAFNPFNEEANEEAEKLIREYEDQLVKRRNYDHEKRERLRFDRNCDIPAFKFYNKVHQIKELSFEIYMEKKR